MMKTRSFGKLIALVLCVAMAFSVSATAFAAEPSKVEYTQSDMAGNAITIDMPKIMAMSNIKMPNADKTSKKETIQLGANQIAMKKFGELSANQVVEITVSCTPTVDELHVGLVLDTASSGRLAVVEGGNGTIYALVPTSGTYILMIGNPTDEGPLTVTITYRILQ